MNFFFAIFSEIHLFQETVFLDSLPHNKVLSRASYLWKALDERFSKVLRAIREMPVVPTTELSKMDENSKNAEKT